MKKIINYISLFYLITVLLPVNALNWMPSNYWFAGEVHISSIFYDLTYQMYYYDDATKKYKLSPVKLGVNKNININEVMGGIRNSPFVWCCDANDQGKSFLLVPNKPYTDYANPQGVQTYEKQLKSGYLHPYIVVSRQAGVITICIVGPMDISIFNSKMLTFNTTAFENSWVVNSPWYKGLKEKSPGMIFGFSFNADNGNFLNSSKSLSDDAFYISGISDFSWPNGYSWTLQGNRKNIPAKDVTGMTMKKLQQQGIFHYQKPFVNLDELQAAIDFINLSGQGKFDDVLPGQQKTSPPS